MTEVKFTIGLNPVTKKNNGRIITKPFPKLLPSKRYEEYEKACGWFLGNYKDLKISEPVNVKAIYYRQDRRRIDLCNLHEALCDMLVHYGVIEDDNSEIVATMDGSKVLHDKENPRTEVTITWL